MQLRTFSSYVVLNPTWPNVTNSSAIIKQAVYTINNILESYELRTFSSYVVLNPTWPNGTNSSAIIKQAVYTINNILESYAAKDLLVLCCS